MFWGGAPSSRDPARGAEASAASPGTAWERNTIIASPPRCRSCCGSPGPPFAPRDPPLLPGPAPGTSSPGYSRESTGSDGKTPRNPPSPGQQRPYLKLLKFGFFSCRDPREARGDTSRGLGDALGVTGIVPWPSKSPAGTNEEPGVGNSHPEPSPASGGSCLFKENDESVFKQREPVFIRVFPRKTNQKSGGSGSSAQPYVGSAGRSPGERCLWGKTGGFWGKSGEFGD